MVYSYILSAQRKGNWTIFNTLQAEELEGTDAYAASTAPFNLEVEESTIPGAGFGIFTTDVEIPENVQMGPYKGKVVKITSGASDAARDRVFVACKMRMTTL